MPAAQLIGYRPLDLGFNSIPNLKDHAGIDVTNDILIELGSMLREHELNGEFGITRIHRHFDLKQQEILVHSMSPDASQSILSPWTLQDGRALPADMSLLASHSMKVCPFIVPRTWMLADGVLVPCEYANVNALVDGQATFEFEPSFVEELQDFLSKHGLEGQIGVTRLRKEKDMHGLETTNRAARCSTTIYVANQEEALERGGVQVTWDFSTKKLAGFCADSCSTNFC